MELPCTGGRLLGIPVCGLQCGLQMQASELADIGFDAVHAGLKVIHAGFEARLQSPVLGQQHPGHGEDQWAECPNDPLGIAAHDLQSTGPSERSWWFGGSGHA